MIHRFFLLSFAIVLSIVGIASATIDEEDDKLIDTTASEQPVVEKTPEAVLFSKKLKSLDLKKAYKLQKAFVKNSVAKGVRIYGFKAGLTASGAPEKFGLHQPITGVLLQPPLQGNEISISQQHNRKLMMEQELAFQVGVKITKPLAITQVMDHIVAVSPAMEFPDMSFASDDFNGFDIIANNALANEFMIGEWKSPKMDLDELKVSLSCDDKTLNEGEGRNAMGKQLKALHWMINHIVNQGYAIQEGQILITGNLGQMLPATFCDYTASYGELGKLSFKLTL